MDSLSNTRFSDHEYLFGDMEDSESSISSNATASDLPGPGRVLGKMYSHYGRKLEIAIGKIAERMGYGPRVVAERVRRRASLIRTYESGLQHIESCSGRSNGCWKCTWLVEQNQVRVPAAIQAKKRKVVKDCKKLLKYVKPTVQSTHIQAMDALLDLSIEDFELRAVLKSLGATRTIWGSIKRYSAFRYSEYDNLLLASSRKALVCFEESEVISLLQEWVAHSISTYDKTIEERITPYLYYPRTGFLVIRVFLQVLKSPRVLYYKKYSLFLQHMVSAVGRMHSDVEWEECDRVFDTLLPCSCPIKNLTFRDVIDKDVKYGISNLLLRHFDKLPRVRKQTLPLPSTIRELKLQRGGDADLNALQNRFSSPLLQPLLPLLACPIENAISTFIAGKYINNSLGFYFDEVPASDEASLFDKIALPNQFAQDNAWNAIDFFLAHDIYRCNMMLKALSKTPFAPTLDFFELAATMRRQCKPKDVVGEVETVYRHFHKTDNQIHLSSSHSKLICGSAEEQELIYPSEWIMTLRIRNGEAYSSAGLYPLIAGYDKDGKCTYVGEAYCSYICPICHNDVDGLVLCAVTEGIKPKDLRFEVECCQKRVVLFTEKWIYLDIYCLRYAPDAYLNCYENFPNDNRGVDATGPFAWRPVRAPPPRNPEQKPILRRVLSLEEAASLEREGVPVYNPGDWSEDEESRSDSESDTSSSSTSDDEGEVRDDFESDEESDEAKHARESEEPIGGDIPRRGSITDEPDSGEPLEPVESDNTETGGLVQVGKTEPGGGGTEIEADSESDEADFVSFIEKENNVESRSPGKVNNVKLDYKSLGDIPLTCGGRIDIRNSIEQAEGESGKVNITETASLWKILYTSSNSLATFLIGLSLGLIIHLYLT